MRRAASLLFFATFAAPVLAQSTPGNAPPQPRAGTVSESTVSERVRREASNPLRIILEAARIRRAGAEPEPVAAAATRRTAPSSAPPAPLALPAATPAMASAAPAVVDIAAPEPATAVLRAPAMLRTSASLSAAPAPAPADQLLTVAPKLDDVPALPAARIAPLAIPQTAAVEPLPALRSALPPPAASTTPSPRLLSMVNPEIPSNVMRRLGYPNEMVVQVTINRDGSVSNISMPSPAVRSAEPYIVEALAQWKFEPVAEPRQQRLQLVFNN